MSMMGPSYIKKIQSGLSAQDIRNLDKAKVEDAVCAPGKSCLGTEALGEMMNGGGVQFPPSTKKILDDIRSTISTATEMVDAANVASSTGMENGIFGISSIFVERISDLGASIGQVPESLQSVWGDGSFIDAIEGHMKKLMPDDISKFAQNFGEIESIVSKSSESMYNAVQGATESLDNPLEKVAGQFANMASGDGTGATFSAAASQLKSLGNLPLEGGPTALLSSLQSFPGIQKVALEKFNTLDLTDFTDSSASELLSSVTNSADIELIRKGLGVPGKGGSALDFLNKSVSSKGAISDGAFDKYVKSFGGDFGALANEGIVALGEAAEKLSIPKWGDGTGTFPGGKSKISDAGVKGIKEQFGGGSGENGAISFKDLMGTVMGSNEDGSPSEFEKALQEYKNALKKTSSDKVFSYIKDACYGDWSETKSSSDGGTKSTGIGANPAEIADTSANSFTLNGALYKLVPDAEKAAEAGAASAQAAAEKIAAIMSKEQELWSQMGLSITEIPGKFANIQALTGFADSLASKMQNPATKSALINSLTGATKALGDSGKFETVLQNDVGVSSTNQITPKTS